MQTSFRIPFAAVFALFAVSLFTTAVFAADIAVKDGFVRETPLKVSAGYMSIVNNGKEEDALQSVTAPWADKIEMHDVKINDSGVLEMLPMGEIALKPGETVKLSPGGRHLMIYGLKEKLVAGEKRNVTLHFAKAGAVKADVIVRPVTYRGEKDDGKKNAAPMDHMNHMDHMDHMQMGH